MSAICAVLRLDGRDAACETLAPVLAGLAARGPDATGAAADGPVALGHMLNATTPEALVEPMPLRHAATGCVISADVRLDNRDSLIGALGLTPAGRVIGDGELILRAYLKWGLDCPVRLAGDFAFVLWDPRHRRLFAARDKVGMRQLIYYHHPGKLFACATDAEAVVSHPDVPARINEGRIADHLESLEAIDETSTFFVDLFRLPPAHAMAVEAGNLRLWRYWHLEPPGLIVRSNDRAYEEAFLEVFTQAVRVRLRARDGVLGSMLSGGMDSGSVVAVASRLMQQAGAPPLKTFSAIDTDPGCIETRAIRASLEALHLDPHLVSTGDLAEFRDEVNHARSEHGEPFDGHMAMVWAIYRETRRSGMKVLLDGLGGDTTLGSGNVVNWYIEHGQFSKAWREAQGDEAFWGKLMPARQQFLTLLRQAYVPLEVRKIWHRIKPLATGEDPASPKLLSESFAARVNFAERYHRYQAHCALGRSCSAATRAKRMLHPCIIAGRERYDRVAGAFGVEQRDPFFDPKVFEFCLTLPLDQLKSGGWPKFILRRAMEGYLPDKVRWRTGSAHVGRKFAFLCNAPKTLKYQKMIHSVVGPYVRNDRLTAWLGSEDEDSALAQIGEVRYLADWLIRMQRDTAPSGA